MDKSLDFRRRGNDETGLVSSGGKAGFAALGRQWREASVDQIPP
jgi:hypothetical protein